MDWQNQLIFIYINVCEYFAQDQENRVLRISPNSKPIFTDEEAITIFIFGIIQTQSNVKKIHMYTQNHLKNWFPDLPKYEAFNYRINFLKDEIFNFSNYFFQKIDLKTDNSQRIIVIDSLPIMLSKGFRSLKSKTANQICNKGYCSSKNEHYYGVKFHLFADRNNNSLAIPKQLSITKASTHDLTAVKEFFPEFSGYKILGDKAYSSAPIKKMLAEQKVEIHTPVKLSKSKKYLTGDEKVYSKMVSSLRQSIEIFFSWIIEKTNIQKASKVRSEKGLIAHIFGRFTAALFLLKLNF